MSLRSLLLADLAVNWGHRGVTTTPSGWRDVIRSVADPRFAPVVILRLAKASDERGGWWSTLGKILALLNRLVFGVECALQTDIGPGLYFPHTGGIVIGAARLGSRCTVYHQVTFGAKEIDMAFTPGRRPVIGDDVTIASGAKVLGGVTVGDRVVVAANAVVVANVPDDVVVAGVPARTLRTKA